MQVVSSQYDKEIFNLGIRYLCTFNGISEDNVKQRIEKPIVSLPNDIRDIYRRLIISAQNYQSMPNIIGKAIGGIDNLSPILHSFSPHDVVKHYGMNDIELLDKIIEDLNPRGSVRRTSRSSWPKFCRGVLDGADFLSQFQTAKEFYDWCDFFDQDHRARIALPLLISHEVNGIGFALACDFIKELGYLNFGKPDVHIKGIFLALELCHSEDDLEIFKALQRVAQSTEQSVFAVDKLFWSIGKDELNVGTDRNAFIEYALNHMDS